MNARSIAVSFQLRKSAMPFLIAALVLVAALGLVSQGAYAADYVTLPSGEVQASTLESGHKYIVPNEGATIVLKATDNVTVDSFEYASSGTEVLTIKGADSGKLTVTDGVNLDGSNRKFVVEGGTVDILKSDTSSEWASVVVVGQYVQHGGTVSISANKSTNGGLYGVRAVKSDGDAFEMDGGTLNIGVTNTFTSFSSTHAVKSSGNVNISGGSVTASAQGNNLVAGLEADKNITVSGGTLSFSGQSTNISSSGAKQGYGIHMNDNGSAFTATGGNITAIGESKSYEAYGVSLRTTTNITDATLTAKAKSETTTNGSAMGIYLFDGSLVLNGSTLNLEAENNASAAYGLYLNQGSLSATNSNISVTSKSTTSESEADGIRKQTDTASITLDKTTLTVNASGPSHLTGIHSAGQSGDNPFTAKNRSKVTVNVKSTGTESSTEGDGIYFGEGLLSLEDPELKVVSDITNNSAYGIRGGSMTLSGESSVDAEVKTANNIVRGIDLNNTLTMTGAEATLRAKVSTSNAYSYALKAPSQSIAGFSITQPEGGAFDSDIVKKGSAIAGEVTIEPPAPNHLYVSTYVDDSHFSPQLNASGFLVKRDDKDDTYQKGQRDYSVRPNASITLSGQTSGEGVYVHYELKEWRRNTKDGDLLSTDASYAHTMGAGDETIVAVFKPIVTEIPRLTLSGTVTQPMVDAHPVNPTITVSEEGAMVQSAYWADVDTHFSLASDAVFETDKHYELRIVVIAQNSYYSFADPLPATLNGESIGADGSDRSIRVKTYTAKIGDVSTATVAPISNQTYTGHAIIPAPVVKLGGVTLVKGTDYDVTYANNVNVGTATVTITGKGSYTGSVTRTFNIVAPAYQTMHRLYNPYSGEHFYTADASERNYLVRVGWRYEGEGWKAPTSGQDVYRLYNPNAGDHHYTKDASERNYLVSVGWRYEGVGWKSGGSTPLYRQYNPYAQAGSHNYTTSKSENDYLVSVGWRPEGIGWYGV